MSLAIAVISSMVCDRLTTLGRSVVLVATFRAVAGDALAIAADPPLPQAKISLVALDGLRQGGCGAIDSGRPHGSKTPCNQAYIVRDESAGVRIFPAGELG